MPAFAFVLATSAAVGVRIASLNLCTDETLLMLARPDEIASVSYLSQLPAETALWRYARHFPANAGSLESALRTHPTVVLTMGGGGRATAMIAKRLGFKTVDLPFASTLAEVEAQWSAVAVALGDPARARQMRTKLDRLRAMAPRRSVDAVFLGSGGQSLGPGSLGAQWMSLAGLRQRPLKGGRVSLEDLATRPPSVLLQSRYRAGQTSRGLAWLDHPIVRRLASRTRVTDGRPWTCSGAPMLEEIQRLRSLIP
jgi:iron complex transport system substrate-binding protein